MKKLSMGLAGGVVLAAAALFFLSSMLVEQNARKTMNQVNLLIRESGYDVRLELLEVKKGLPTSTLEWKLNLGQLGQEIGVDSLRLTDRARPGCTGVVVTTHLQANAWYRAWVDQKLGGKDPLTITSTYPWVGDQSSTLALSAFKIKMPDGQTLQVKPGELTTTVDQSYTHLTGKGRFEGLRVADVLNLVDLEFEMDQKRASEQIWKGSSRVSLGECFVSGEMDEFWLTNAWVSSSLSMGLGKRTLSLDLEYGMDNADLPRMEIGESRMKFRIDGVNVSAYEKLMALYTKMVRETQFTGHDQAQVDRWIERHQAVFLASFEALLKEGLSFEVYDVKLSLPQGDVSGDFSLSLIRDTTLTQLIPMGASPQSALEIFSLKSGIRVPVSFATQYPFLLQPMLPGMQTGLFVPDGDSLSLGVETRDGRFILNGSELILQ